jgi:hypothetical protein
LPYSVEPISIEDKEELSRFYSKQILYETKSDIYGCCIKLLTGIQWVKDRWEENFYSMSYSIRSHGRLYVVEDLSREENTVLYEPQSKTAFLINLDYYGWIKSLALSVAGDILEDEHNIFSVHGACLDIKGKGISILGGPGVGKTTHTYGLLRNSDLRVVSDDWFFSRIFESTILAFGSERNSYIRADLAKIWPEFKELMEHAEFDAKQRAVVDIRWVIGKGRNIPFTTLRNIIILKRDSKDPEVCKELDMKEALKILESNNYFNPHLLVQNKFKRNLRNEFFKALLKVSKANIVNTIKSPEESQKIIGQLLEIEKA